MTYYSPYLTMNSPTIPLLCRPSISNSYFPGLIGTNLISISPSLSNSISLMIDVSISIPSTSIFLIQTFLKNPQLQIHTL